MSNKQANKPRKGTGAPGNMAAPGEKPKNFKKPWGKLIAYCKPYLPAIIFALVLATVGTIFTIIGPNMLSEITDLIMEGITGEIDITAIGKIGLLLAILYGLSFIFNYIQAFIMATITQRVSKRLRSDISNKIDKLPLKYFDSTTYGDVLSRVTNDVDMIGQSLNQSIGSLVTAGVMFFGSLIMMFSINVTMTLSAIAATVVGFVLMIFIISKSRKYFIRQQQDLGRINGHIEEIYSGHEVMKVYNGEKAAKQEFNEINESLFNSAWRAQFMSGMMMPLMIFIGNLGYVVVCVVGAALTMKGSITFGVIVSFMVYIRLFTQPLSQFAQAATSLQSTAAASERVFEFLQEEELKDESDKKATLDAKDVKGNVQFKNVKFGYTKEKLIINDFSAQIKAGQKVAIVGPTGAGKTTLVNLLMRFYEVDSGEIMIEDVATKSITRKNVHDLFCMVLQDTWLFEGTVKENIVYNKEAVTEEEVVAACKAVGLDHFIRTLPKGYETVLNDKTSLSVGQKQLITIARAMVKKAPLLILDEATSSVDTRTEALIQEAMDKLMVGKTSFVIAHRLSTIKNADLILVMKDGDIIESGNHEELIAEKGFYADLYNSQFENVS
ncbi:ABC transporter ATP-binding protein [Lysinibacillus agricola]|uniref:ABC transporter ATP-binding protein n=1 Tax=Lysinibacillus agricola TaxID=2590012 RepID=A0ABX7AXI3_9BACI|nr:MULTISPECIES: ABC transporter ATP-binding protein [Lysinibacillus]KOS60214.1 ABC transporter [Lysinibacillus sp. FJAT-14222]QQP14504.1 ABC transporter ATP-binding protein [Lysinibacillus agricola]